jgi:hypothetical protein
VALQPKTYTIAPNLRRSCWYVIIAVMVFAPLSVWLAVELEHRSMHEVIIWCAGSFLLVLILLWPLRWRLKVADEGLARYRVFFGWDWWIWDDFAAGRVLKHAGYALFDPQRARWRRKLDLGCLGKEERREVFSAINEHYQLPPPPELPATLTIRWGCRRQATLDETGIHLGSADESQHYRWYEVRQILIARYEPLRRDFQSLDMALPDSAQDISLMVLTTPTWTGASAEHLSEFLCRHVAAERIEVGVVDDPQSSPLLRAKMLTSLRKRRQELRWLSWLGPIAFVVLAVTTFTDDARGLLLAAALSFTILLFPLSIFLLGSRHLVKRIEEIEQHDEVGVRT